ncbi:lysophospholipid acyltransferase family protein [Actibacterium sp. XHP0104]|uniref:lysophospholipid acyltransferase family protein n=1 Tax=Actibacterium sp. XHP0104 TaxID=2984335 RepID=UPI0021E883AE|nr:lysophospholipid acyltransferase family protein [Actibacterium sp. XHP0104]MCV2880918.1 lysophospholipid acyltransferase family protein [Actibacterium sp. XHP0104]
MPKQFTTGQKASLWLTDRLIRGVFALMLALPWNTRVRLMGWITARIISPIAGYDRRIRENLRHVMPDLPDAEVRRIVRAVPDNVGRTLIEIYSGPQFMDRVRPLPLTGPGAQTLETAMAEKRPIMLVTGHFGNYMVPRAALFARGHPVGALYNPMRNPFFNRHYTDAMEEIGKPMFPRGRKGLAQMLRFLSEGGTVGILVDQFMKRGEPLNFFGKPALTALSAAEMAMKYDALLIPIYGVRQPDGIGFEIVVEPPIPHTDPTQMTQALNDSLEAITRAHMDQWFWIHRRWKPEKLAKIERARAARETD